MKTYGRCTYSSTILDLGTIVGGKWSVSRPGRFTPGERGPVTHLIGSCVGTRARLNTEKEGYLLTLPGIELWPSNP
jgi:hypothetical protein